MKSEFETLQHFLEENPRVPVNDIFKISLLDKLENIRFELSDIAFSLREGLLK